MHAETIAAEPIPTINLIAQHGSAGPPRIRRSHPARQVQLSPEQHDMPSSTLRDNDITKASREAGYLQFQAHRVNTRSEMF